jgi:hypothetical protein
LKSIGGENRRFVCSGGVYRGDTVQLDRQGMPIQIEALNANLRASAFVNALDQLPECIGLDGFRMQNGCSREKKNDRDDWDRNCRPPKDSMSAGLSHCDSP